MNYLAMASMPGIPVGWFLMMEPSALERPWLEGSGMPAGDRMAVCAAAGWWFSCMNCIGFRWVGGWL